VNIFRVQSSIFTGKLTLVSLSAVRRMSVISLDRFSFSAAFFIIVFAFSSVILGWLFCCF